MVRVTIDSNIYISALISAKGKPHEILEQAREGHIWIAVSEAILDEVFDVLQRKFAWPEDDIAEARRQIGSFTYRVNPPLELDVIKDDPDDNRVLECASASSSDCIVTGDKDLLRLRWYDSIRILTATEFLDFERQLEP